jgi:DNA-binding SARP family transcriptional activator
MVEPRATAAGPHVTPARDIPFLGLISGFELRRSGSRVTLPLSAQRLLAFLALQHRPVLRVYVAGTLWADSTEDRAKASLRSALWRLQRAGRAPVRPSSTHLVISPEVRVDAEEIVALAHRCIEGRDEIATADVERLCGTGDVLPDWYDDWLIVERERFRQLRLHALDAVCSHLTVAGRFGEAIEAGLASVASEPLRESAHRAVIGAHLAEGNVAEAVRQFESCCALLRARVGTEPSRKLRGMLEAV